MQIDENSKITDLLDKAKAAIEQGESSLRKAAEYIAQAQDEGATQKQIAGRIGRSQPWVTQLLSWRKGGYKGGAFDRSNKARISRTNNSKAKPETAGEREARWNAKARQADADKAKAEAAQAKAEARKAANERKAEQARARTAREEAKRANNEAFSAVFGGGHKKKEIYSSVRTLLVKILGMLGSDEDGEIANAGRQAERIRKNAGMTWDDLIIEAIPAARRFDEKAAA